MTVQAGPPVPPRSQDRVVAELAELIRQAGPDGRLPTERDLAQQMQVNRATVRGRLDMLGGLGIVRRRQGAGTFIGRLDPAALAFALNVALTVSDISLDSLHSVRVALERQAAREAAQLQDHVRIAEMRVALDRLRNADYGDEEQTESADFDLHDALLRASGNPALEFFADALSSVLREALHYRRAGLRQLTNDRSVMDEVHTSIVDGVLSGDPGEAAAAVDRHFQAYEDQLRSLEQDT